MAQYEDQYFAAKKSEEVVEVLNQKKEDWFDATIQNGYLTKIRNSWNAYHGAYYGSGENDHTISLSGEQGEIVNLPVNDYRNLARHMLVMVTSNRPVFQSRAVNTDYKSVVQTRLANQLLEYYMREEKLERYLKAATEHSIVGASGYVKLEWNSEIGDVYDYDEETDTKLREGRIQFKVLSPLGVIFDSTKESFDEVDWVITRSWKNKYDLAAKFPELADQIKQIKTKSDMEFFKLFGRHYDETVDIAVYEFFHKKTEVLPEGRYMLYLDESVVLMDTDLPYKKIPVYRISPAEILGTPYGYTDMFDVLPLQDASNTLYSTVLTNQNAFGVQNIISPNVGNFNYKQLAGGINHISYTPFPGLPNGGKPESLNLTDTPAEIFKFIEMLSAKQETLIGMNPATRGIADQGVTSGNALALLHSQSLEFMSGLQQNYIQLIEDVGTGIIELLQSFAHAPRIASIVGENNREELRTFTGADIDQVNKVIVDVGNALSQTTAGRVQIAEQLLQMMPEQLTPQQYINVMNTGRIDDLTHGTDSQILLTKSENEMLTDGSGKVQAIFTENHALHIQEHNHILSDPILKQDPELVQRVLDHIQEHITLLRTSDPDLLAILGQQPLGPVGGSAVSPQNAAQGGLNQQGSGGPQATPDPLAAAQAANQLGPLPVPAQPPELPDISLPIGPQ